jgi:hypothetical protein
MVTSGLLAVSALCLIQAEAMLVPDARFETRVGEAPSRFASSTTSTTTSTSTSTSPFPPQQFQVVVSASPALSLYWWKASDSLQASATTRILWRPEPLYDQRPIFLEVLDVSYSTRPTRRSDWQLHLHTSLGEEDYFSLSQQFANDPALSSSITSMTALMADAAATHRWRATRRTTWSLQMEAIYRHSIDALSSANGSTLLPPQSIINATPGLQFAYFRDLSANLQLQVSDHDVNRPTSGQTASATQPAPSIPSHYHYIFIQPQIGFHYEPSHRNQLQLAIGFTYPIYLIGTDPGGLGFPILPYSLIGWTTVLQRARTNVIQLSLTGGTTAFTDPILGYAVLRGSAQASVMAELGPRWRVSTSVVLTTDLSKLPSLNGVSPDETILSVEVPVSYRWPHQMGIDFGGRYGERAPHFSDPNFAWRERELWAYVTLYTLPPRLPLPSS